MNAFDSAQATQPLDASQPRGGGGVQGITINPRTGLATDYLNRFNEAIMLLEMLESCPECLEEFLAWKPVSYREHFANSRFTDRRAAIAAYDAADPAVRRQIDFLADTMTAMIRTTLAALRSDLSPTAAAQIAQHAAGWLKPLVARAAAVINGDLNGDDATSAQAAVDRLMRP